MNYMTMLYKVVGDDWVENGRRCSKLGKDMKSWMRWGGNATNHMLLLLSHNFSKYILLLARCSTWAILPWPQTMWIEGIHVKKDAWKICDLGNIPITNVKPILEPDLGRFRSILATILFHSWSQRSDRAERWTRDLFVDLICALH